MLPETAEFCHIAWATRHKKTNHLRDSPKINNEDQIIPRITNIPDVRFLFSVCWCIYDNWGHKILYVKITFAIENSHISSISSKDRFLCGLYDVCQHTVAGSD